MAVYASTVTLYLPQVERISRNLGILVGKISITNYNSTTTEETNITRYFKASGVAAIAKGILSMSIVSQANGYVWGFDKATGKFKVFQTATVTPAGTNGASNVTGTVVVGGGAAGTALGITTDDNSGTLTKAAATARNIPIATFLGVIPQAGAQTFTGAATTAAALSEVANDTNVGAADFIAVGFIAAGGRGW